MKSTAAAIEPLEPELWFRAFARLAARQRQPGGSDVETLLRHGFHLLQLTPGPLRHFVRCKVDESAMERLLAAGALDQAALALVGAPLCFEVGSSPSHSDMPFAARVRFPGTDDQWSSSYGSTVACALLGAWAGCLGGLMQRSLRQQDRPLRPVLHIAPAAQRRRWSEH